MEGDFRINVDDVLKAIKTAEVLSIYFPRLRKTLLVDTRFGPDDPPMIRLVPMTTSLESRFRSLRRWRPRMPRSQAITIIPWPRYVESLVRLGVWDQLLQRFAETGHREVIQTCTRVLRELRRLEHEEVAEAIQGDHYRTIWPRSR